jgi:hypothetical protein
MDDTERDKKVLEKYPLHILLMVKAAKKALDDGRARIEDGLLVVDSPPEHSDLTRRRKEM